MTSIAKDGSVEFWFFRRDVREVRIVGNFDPASGAPGGAGVGDVVGEGLAMAAGPDGWWRATVALAAGEYRFRYVADGVWYADYASNGIEVTRQGPSSVLVVPQSADQTMPGDAARMVA